MKSKFKMIVFISDFILCLLLCSCWNLREVDDMPVVVGTGVDIVNDQYKLTTQIITPVAENDTHEVSKITNYYTCSETLFEAIRDLIISTGKKVFWAHEKYIIISEDTAKKGIGYIFDFFTRDDETRDDMWVLICRGEANKYLEYERTGEKMSFYIVDLMKNVSANSKYDPKKMYEFQDAMTLKGKEGTLPYLVFTEDLGPEVDGNAVFKNDIMVGTLDRDETKTLRIIENREKGGILSVILKQSDDKKSKFSIEIDSSETKINPILKDDNINMKLTINTSGKVGELVNSVFDNKNIKEFESRAALTIKKRVVDLIHKAQTEYESDIFGFGEMVKNTHPKFWRTVEDNWDSYFEDMMYTVDVKVSLNGSGLYQNAIVDKE